MEEALTKQDIGILMHAMGIYEQQITEQKREGDEKNTALKEQALFLKVKLVQIKNSLDAESAIDEMIKE